MTHEELRRWVLERDHYRCVDCGAPTCSVHHIISRRYEGAWDESNMVTLCYACHLEGPGKVGAHTHQARKRHLTYLRDRYGYEYHRPKWLEALEEA